MTKPSDWEGMTTEDLVSNAFVEAVTFGMVFLFGAMVGSFVNVILYRLPPRMNLFWPPSRCPACGKRLRLTDNVPVAGWLLLRGKCRRCRAPIPVSYLRVEVGFGLLFLAVMYLIVHTGGWTFPLRDPNHYVGSLWTIWYPQPETLALWGYSTALAAVLATLLLFARRGERLPGLFVASAVLFGVLLPAVVTGLQQVPWAGEGSGNLEASRWRTAGWVEAATGALAGAFVGIGFGLAWPPRRVKTESRPRLAIPPQADAAMVLAVAGAWLGWQAVVSVALLAAVGGLMFRRTSVVTLLIGATSLQFIGWRVLTQFAPWWLGPRTGWLFVIGWAAALTGLVLSGRWVRPLTATPEAEPSTPSPPPSEPPPAPAVPGADSAVDTASTGDASLPPNSRADHLAD